ncbi:MAG: 2-dehydropantoate 2-reductase [Pseudomonadales bacterium]|nr:2-dehydropantoate 2-reductase [Pseudomonadales bacterium]
MTNSKLEQPQHWAILGAGSLGCLWAAYLSKTNTRITLILKNRESQQVWENQKGLSLEFQERTVPIGVDGLTRVNTCIADDFASKKQGSFIDVLLVTTKAHQTLDAVLAIKPTINDNTAILLMQNGLGIYEELKTALPNAIILCASTTEGAYQKQRFQVVHAGQGTTYLGNFETDKNITDTGIVHANNKNYPHLLSLQEVLSTTGLQVEIDPQIESRLWQKLAINCAINGLTVVHQCQNGKLLPMPDAKNRMKKICDEVASVMIAKGILSNQAPVTGESLFETVEQVAIATQYNYSSMLQDLNQQRSTEIAYINGYLIRQAEQLNLPCPYNRELLHQVNELTAF